MILNRRLHEFGRIAFAQSEPMNLWKPAAGVSLRDLGYHLHQRE
jgi:hypothetical protein